MAANLKAGDPAPAFTLRDDTGADVSLENFRGRRVIIYFYPAAATPGRTTQACDFRDNLADLNDARFAVLGVSPDAPHRIGPVPRRPAADLSPALGSGSSSAGGLRAWGDKTMYGRTVPGVIRSTIVVDAQGVVERAQYNVKAIGSVARLLRDLKLTAS